MIHTYVWIYGHGWYGHMHPLDKNCNCRGGVENCPVGARCKDDKVIYQAYVTAPGRRREGYVGMSAPSWKLRYANHTSNFRNPGARVRTKLAGHVWELKDEGLVPELKWQFLATAPTYKPSTKTCRLCIAEKFYIMHHPSTSGRSSSSPACTRRSCYCNQDLQHRRNPIANCLANTCLTIQANNLQFCTFAQSCKFI